eukprot:384688-Pelagomonas_calceolata.AAC.9
MFGGRKNASYASITTSVALGSWVRMLGNPPPPQGPDPRTTSGGSTMQARLKMLVCTCTSGQRVERHHADEAGGGGGPGCRQDAHLPDLLLQAMCMKERPQSGPTVTDPNICTFCMKKRPQSGPTVTDPNVYTFYAGLHARLTPILSCVPGVWHSNGPVNVPATVYACVCMCACMLALARACAIR